MLSQANLTLQSSGGRTQAWLPLRSRLGVGAALAAAWREGPQSMPARPPVPERRTAWKILRAAGQGSVSSPVGQAALPQEAKPRGSELARAPPRGCRGDPRCPQVLTGAILARAKRRGGTQAWCVCLANSGCRTRLPPSSPAAAGARWTLVPQGQTGLGPSLAPGCGGKGVAPARHPLDRGHGECQRQVWTSRAGPGGWQLPRGPRASGARPALCRVRPGPQPRGAAQGRSCPGPWG